MAAAEHGASFPAAKKIRGSMTHQQMHDFASGPMTDKPEHASPLKGNRRDIVHENTKSFKASGQNEHEATKASIKAARHPHSNLGKFLHPAKQAEPTNISGVDDDDNWG